MADVNLISIIMHRRDQSNFVASNIKHSEFPNLIGVWKDFAQLRKIQNRSLRMIAYQRARDDLVSGCLRANSFKRFRVMTCTRANRNQQFGE